MSKIIVTTSNASGRSIGDTCADSYASYLEMAATKVGEACSKFIPQ